MDLLTAELSSKRKAMKEDPVLATRPNKYMRRGDVEKFKQEQEQKLRDEKALQKSLEDQKNKVCMFFRTFTQNGAKVSLWTALGSSSSRTHPHSLDFSGEHLKF